MALKRLPNWDTQLLPAFVASRRTTPFAWGTNDCSLFAADAVLAITGEDIADAFRGRYTDEASAFGLIKALTGGTDVAHAAAYCATKHGLTEYSYPKLAKRGDLVVLTNAGRVIAGVVHTDGRHIVSVGEKGLLYLPISQAQRAWAV
jgi:hypothetical protein